MTLLASADRHNLLTIEEREFIGTVTVKFFGTVLCMLLES